MSGKRTWNTPPLRTIPDRDGRLWDVHRTNEETAIEDVARHNPAAAREMRELKRRIPRVRFGPTGLYFNGPNDELLAYLSDPATLLSEEEVLAATHRQLWAFMDAANDWTNPPVLEDDPLAGDPPAR